MLAGAQKYGIREVKYENDNDCDENDSIHGDDESSHVDFINVPTEQSQFQEENNSMN